MYLIVLATLPSIVIIIFILRHDKYIKEPINLLIKLFVVGAIIVIPAAILESLFPSAKNQDIFDVFFSAFIGVALIEEGLKFIGVRLFSFKNYAFDEIYDGVIYCVMVSLGFATVENIMYVLSSGLSTAILRALTAVPAHTIFAIVMGYYISMGKFAHKKRFYYKFMSLTAPTLLHGTYDFILFTNYDFALLIFIPFVIYLYIKGIRIVKATSDIPPVQNDHNDNIEL